MRLLAGALLAVLVALAMTVAGPAHAQPSERRFALVIGNGAYPSAPLPTAGNDAGLIAQTLQGAGFDVIGARDLDAEGLRGTFRDFLDKVATAGPDAVVMVYLSGYGLQFEGDNFFVPIDARIERDIDVPLHALRLSDYLRPLSALKSKGVIVVLDLARDAPFARGGDLAGGLALVEPTPGMLVAFNAAPGTVGTPSQEPYGIYAEALAEMMRDGGLPAGPLFDRVRLRVSTGSKGAMLPWHAGRLAAPFLFFERGTDAPPEVASVVEFDRRAARPIRDFGETDAYLAALERDSLTGYLDYLDAYPNGPNARRVRAIVAARREAITWRKARNADTPEAYWTYLDRYPRGPHAGDAKRRLAYLTAPIAPPPTYTTFIYDVPPPPRDEIVFIERRVVYYGDPVYAFAPLPLVPIFFLAPPPPPRYFPPPPPPMGLYVLPVPVFVPVPRYIRAPINVAPPPNNVVFKNIHNTTIYNNTVVNQPGPSAPGAPATPPPSPPSNAGPSATTIGAGVVAGTLVGAAAARVALPPSLAKRPDAPPTTAVSVPASVPGSAPGAVVPPVAKSPPAAAKQPAALPGAPAGTPLPPTRSATNPPPVETKGAQPVGAGTPPSAPGSVPKIPGTTPPKAQVIAPLPAVKSAPVVTTGPAAKTDVPTAGKAAPNIAAQPKVKTAPTPATSTQPALKQPALKQPVSPPAKVVTPPTVPAIVKPATVAPPKTVTTPPVTKPTATPVVPPPAAKQIAPPPVAKQVAPPTSLPPRTAPVVIQPPPPPKVSPPPPPRPPPVQVQTPAPAPARTATPPPPAARPATSPAQKKPCGIPGTPPCAP